MRTALQFLRLLTVAFWTGGIAFFAFVLAPVAFTRLPTTHLAGIVVGRSLNLLHFIGIGCGLLFIVATAILYLISEYRKPRIAVQIALITVMLALTAFSQFSIIPRMERDRQQVALLTGTPDGDINAVPLSNPAHADFDRLHHLSENLEGIILLAGIVLVWFLARRDEHA